MEHSRKGPNWYYTAGARGTLPLRSTGCWEGKASYSLYREPSRSEHYLKMLSQQKLDGYCWYFEDRAVPMKFNHVSILGYLDRNYPNYRYPQEYWPVRIWGRVTIDVGKWDA